MFLPLIKYKQYEPIIVICDSLTLPNPYIINYKKNKKSHKIGLVMMVKNEQARVCVSIQSTIGFVDRVIIYDTGSTDNTLFEIINFCKKYKLSLNIIQGWFENFSISRNVVLEYADSLTDINYLLLLDCNDELHNGPALIKAIPLITENLSGFFLMQRWKTAIFIDYLNIRFIKSRHNWRYKGAVHEYISSDNKNKGTSKIPDVILFQDRTKDDNKSFLRFAKDKILLLNEYNSPDKTPRTVYYLAQTFECLNDKENAIKYYKERIYLEDFIEERYHASYHVAQILREMNEPFEKYSGYYLKSLDFMYRVEPLVRIAEYYIDKRNWLAAFFLLNESCKLSVPECGLFIDIEMYKYYRWHLMGIVAYYLKEYEIGLKACQIAISQRHNQIDIHNEKFYKMQLSGKNNIEKLNNL